MIQKMPYKDMKNDLFIKKELSKNMNYVSLVNVTFLHIFWSLTDGNI